MKKHWLLFHFSSFCLVLRAMRWSRKKAMTQSYLRDTKCVKTWKFLSHSARPNHNDRRMIALKICRSRWQCSPWARVLDVIFFSSSLWGILFTVASFLVVGIIVSHNITIYHINIITMTMILISNRAIYNNFTVLTFFIIVIKKKKTLWLSSDRQ